MGFHSLNQIVEVARRCTSFYSKLYKNLPSEGYCLEDIPIASFHAVMDAVHHDYRALFSSSTAYGMFYTTSGTTGQPKATLFGHDEWRIFNQSIANIHWKNGTLKNNDIICNISEPGSASFMAVHGVASLFPAKCSEIPIGCDTSYARIAHTYKQFGANVISGINPTLIGLANYLVESNQSDPQVERLLGGGELLYGSQLDLIKEAFPSALLCPFIYGAAEAGLIGYSELGYESNQFRVFSDLCKVEIIDPKTHKVINECGQIGTVVVTNFVRIATPVIRFGTGDLACWEEPPVNENPRFSLHGRLSPFQHRIANTYLTGKDVGDLIEYLRKDLNILVLQVKILGTMDDSRIKVILSLYKQELEASQAAAFISEALHAILPTVAELIYSKELPPVEVEVVDFLYFESQSKRKWKYIQDDRNSISH